MNDLPTDAATRTTYRLDLEYDGTSFAGWQYQPDVRTVQKCLEDAVEMLFGERVPVVSAGRTDAGVHAIGQVAHIRTLARRTPHSALMGLNSNLPPDVRVKQVTETVPSFHARFSARWRSYSYRIARQPVAVGRTYCWQCPFDLDPNPMRLAAKWVTGSHNFRAFAHESDNETHYLSDVYRADWNEHDGQLELQIEANRFLHGMVRLLVGTFVEVGRHKMNPETVGLILESRDISRSGQKAPATGLTLVRVGYSSWPEL